jgi:hypothetical protein
LINRTEALAVLHEIFDICRETTLIDYVSLDSKVGQLSGCSRSFNIKMECAFDQHPRARVKPILQKHQLEMKEEKGFVLIHSKKEMLNLE